MTGAAPVAPRRIDGSPSRAREERLAPPEPGRDHVVSQLSVTKVSCIGPTNLRVTWDDESSCCVELSGWVAAGGPDRTALKHSGRFAAAQVGADGDGLVWGDLRIDASHLWAIAAEQRTFSQADLAAWQATAGFSNQEAAEFLGISLSAWNAYKAGTNPVPAPVGIVCRAALRDPILCQARHRPRTRGRPRKPDAAALR